MSKTGSANGSVSGNFIYDRLSQRRSHFLRDQSRTVDFCKMGTDTIFLEAGKSNGPDVIRRSSGLKRLPSLLCA